MDSHAEKKLLLAWVLSLTQLIFLLSLWILILASPPVFNAYFSRIRSQPEAHNGMQIVRWLWSDQQKERLNIPLKKVFLTQKEIDHYADVRDWLRRARWICLGTLAIELAALALFRFQAQLVARIQIRTMILIGLGAVGGACLAWWDWKVFFAWIHYPFFGPTSWRLPKGAYSLEIFPASFWQGQVLALVVGALLCSAAALWVAVRRKKDG